MNVFELKETLIADYSSFVKGFITIKDEAIKRIVSDELSAGLLWPEPLLQLSPFFTLGDQIDQLISQGILHPDCAKIFRIKADKSDFGKAIQLYWHQSEAIKQANQNLNYVLTTGTGSGKSLTYIIPIVKRKDEKEYGEYRTKRCILEIYDAMTPLFETTSPSGHLPLTTHNLPLTTNHSPLDPPPGPPCDAEGNFIPVEQWDKNNWPKHIHAMNKE